MNTFKNAYMAELFKMLGPMKKKLIKFIIIMLAIIIAFTALYGLINGVINDFDLDIGSLFQEEGSYDEALQYLNSEYEAYLQQKASRTKIGELLDTEDYIFRANIAKYTFLKNHNIPVGSYRDFGSFSIDSVGYFLFMAEMFVIVFVIYGIVLVSSLIAGEISSGAMKMELIRPIDRNKLLAAKYLAAQTITSILYFLTMLVIIVLGLIFFKMPNENVLVVVNANKVSLISPLSEIIINIISGWFTIFIVIQITTFFSTFSNGKSATAFPILLFLLGGMVENLLAYIYVGYIGINANLNWIKALTLSGPTFNYMNLYGMIAISLIWGIISTLGAHLLFNKKEIHS